VNLHRKNAAEWIMWIVLWPTAWVMRLLKFGSGSKQMTNDEIRMTNQ
jgi:hypothetical protein